MVSTRNRTAAARRKRDRPLAVPQKVRSSKAPQFFKIVYGRDCSNVLYLPPKFVRDVKPLAKQIKIEDFSGQQWSVMLHRYASGSLAFQKGWHKFYIDHDLEEGYILFFTYMQEDHFVVQVFDRTACEKFDFNFLTQPQGKGPQRELDTDSQEKALQGTGVNLRDGLRSDSSIASDTGFQNRESYHTVANGSFDGLQVTPTPMDADLSCIINKAYGHEENRSWLCDLSKFEMVNITEHAERNEKATDPKVVASDAGTNESETQMPAIDPHLVGSSGGLSLDKFSEDLDTTVVIQHQKKGKGQVAVEHENEIIRLSSEDFCNKVGNVSDSKAGSSPSTEVTKGGGTEHSHDALTDHAQNSKMASPCVGKVKGTRRPSISKTVKPRIKKELVELKQDAKVLPAHSCDAGQVPSAKRKHTQTLSPVVKIEPDLEWELGSSTGVTSFTVEVKSYSCLELPVHIQSAPRRRESSQRKIVLLKDSDERVWPLLYIAAFPLKALTGNWEIFCDMNEIKVGDKCRFWSDNQKGMYQVEVVR